MQSGLWNDKRPAGIPDSLGFAAYRSVVKVFERSCERFAGYPAFGNLGVMLNYAELGRLPVASAAYLQKQTDFQSGDRIVMQMPNVLQYPVVTFDVLRAGLVMVNINPLYTAHEIRRQFKDAGVCALVHLNMSGKLVEGVSPDTRIEYLTKARMGDLLSALEDWLVNSVVKSVKKMVPDYRLPQALPLRQALKQGQGHALQPVRVGLEGVAALQYIGGATGVSRGAILTHGDLVANMLQVHVQLSQPSKDGLPLTKEVQGVMIAPLPFYHIYTFTANCMYMMVDGSYDVLIINSRGVPGFIRELKKQCFSALLDPNTLFVALMEYPRFKDVDFPNLRLADSDDTALVGATTKRWKDVTDYTVMEGYGLVECPPVVITNPYGEQTRLGAVGTPVVGMALKTIDEQGNELPVGERGEFYAKGPQVTEGYQQRPEATGEVLDTGDWLKTGDIAVINESGFIRIVDYKKNLILVLGFNVYPSEIEDVMMAHPKVANCAAVDTPDEKPDEAVKLFVVACDPGLSVEESKAYCRENLTGYRIPRQIVFKNTLPMTFVGKILRRELHEIA